MRYAIVVRLAHGPALLYSNRKAVALDPENGIEVGERQLTRLHKAELKRQESDPNYPFPTGYPFHVNGYTVDRMPIKGTKDVTFDDVSDGYRNEWSDKREDF